METANQYSVARNINVSKKSLYIIVSIVYAVLDILWVNCDILLRGKMLVVVAILVQVKQNIGALVPGWVTI